MEKIYIYTHNKRKSREYQRADNVVTAGAKTIQREADWIEYRVGVEGQNYGRPRTFRDAKDRAQQLRRDKPVGVTIRMAAVTTKGAILDVVRFMELRDTFNVPNGPGVEGVDRIEAFIKATMPSMRFAGNCVCKPDSDHADCAATDWFGTWTQMRAADAEFWSKPDFYHAKYSILGDRIKFGPSGSSYYDGTYHSHNHFSVYGGINNSAC